MSSINDGEISIGQDNIVVIRLKRTSVPIVCKALNIKYVDGKAIKIYLDRLVHDTKTKQIGLWTACGAISSILTLQGES